MKNKEGWDGKLRMEPKAVITNPEALEDSDYSDPEAPPVEEIDADEDLLEGEDVNVEDIDLVHCRISSIAALRLDRFNKLQRLCMRQNQISRIDFPSNVAATLTELDLYDNLISHVKGLDEFKDLTSLDLSFNKIKHIKNVAHLVKLTEIFFVQNKISQIEGLEGLTALRNLELGANRIREIENLDSLVALEQLWLGKNKITEMKNLDSLSNLRIISIQSNRLTSITGLSKLPNLEELYLSHNAVTELSGLESNTTLRVLDFSNNQVSHLEHLSTLKNLEELWASNNQLASFDEVERELKDKEKLETVYFEGNPLQLKGPAVYRNKVRLALPQVSQIDASMLRFPYLGL
ncbi:Leucine rich repeats (2 copies) [Penicillium malachiteum]|nr:Leucine rich repeats (2 copies) [Penicillium malachiteum]